MILTNTFASGVKESMVGGVFLEVIRTRALNHVIRVVVECCSLKISALNCLKV